MKNLELLMIFQFLIILLLIGNLHSKSSRSDNSFES